MCKRCICARVAANGATGAVSLEAVDWSAPLPDACSRRRWDYVLAADCVFWPRLFAPLLDTLRALVGASTPPPQVLLTVTSRLDRAARFEAAAAAAGWLLEELSVADEVVRTPSFAHTRLVRLSLGRVSAGLRGEREDLEGSTLRS